MKNKKIKNTVTAALFTAIISAAAAVAIPTPFGITFTLQTLGVCMAGFCLGAKRSVMSVAVYILIGFMGLPVFSSFTGGPSVLFGVTGGFLWGFLLTAFLCGTVADKPLKFKKIAVMILSVSVCHITGILQYCFITGNGFLAGFLTASAPFLLKDLISVFFAYFISHKIKKIIKDI